MPIRDTAFDAIYGKGAFITQHVIPPFAGCLRISG
jgi:hypothetical protein